MSRWLNTNWNGKFQRDTWFELRCLHSVFKTNCSWRTQGLKTTWVQVEEMWYTQRDWTKELNRESAYRRMGGVTMAPSLPPSRHHEVLENWEESEIIAVSTRAREGRDYLELQSTETVEERPSHRACARDHKAGPDHWKLLLLRWPVAAEDTRTLDVCQFPGAIGCKHCFTSETFLSGMSEGIFWFWFWTTCGNYPRSWILINSYHLLTSSRTW